jgi:hypothetical protein
VLLLLQQVHVIGDTAAATFQAQLGCN